MARIVSLLAKCVLMTGFLAALSLGLLAGYRWVTTTELFAVEDIDIRGNRLLSDKRIREMAGLARGENIFAVNMGRMENRLSSSGWIDSVLVRRSLPDALLLEVKERRPVFWIKRGERIYYADAEGKAIAPVRTGTFISLPFLRLSERGGQPGEQLEILYNRLRNRSLPFPLAQIAWIRFFSGEIVEMHLMDRSLRICVGGSPLRDNLNTLVAIWEDLRERDELNRTGRILVYGTRGWVKFDPGESD